MLLIVGGGIAAYKSLELVRLLVGRGIDVIPVLTDAGAQFVTALSLQALSTNTVHTDLFSLTLESEMGHIALSRSSDLVVVCPATADLIARSAQGQANDLASTLLLATDTPILLAPAMNVRMWEHPATQANMRCLRSRGVHVVGPEEGVMACAEYGFGRLSEPAEIMRKIEQLLGQTTSGDLFGKRVLVTAGPTHEPIDPVRYIANRSSGIQGYAIAEAFARHGANVTLISGPTNLKTPRVDTVIQVETACEMLAACQSVDAVDVVICTAAVADWNVSNPATGKIKKSPNSPPPSLALSPNPDILATLSQRAVDRAKLVIGFAAETEDVIAHATAKRLRKGCDWIVANDVSHSTGNMGGEENEVVLITASKIEKWPRLLKSEVGERLALLVASALNSPEQQETA